MLLLTRRQWLARCIGSARPRRPRRSQRVRRSLPADVQFVVERLEDRTLLTVTTSDGTVASYQKIADNTGGLGSLADDDNFGYSFTPLGDVDHDGVIDMAVGALDGYDQGSVHILFMNANGTVKWDTKIASNTNGLGTLGADDSYWEFFAHRRFA